MTLQPLKALEKYSVKSKKHGCFKIIIKLISRKNVRNILRSIEYERESRVCRIATNKMEYGGCIK